MPIVLYGIDGAYRAAIFERSPASRIRLERAAGPGDCVTVCACPDGIPHLAGTRSTLACPDLVLAIHFHAGRPPTVTEGPRFADVRGVHD